jgi:hypothetical protein
MMRPMKLAAIHAAIAELVSKPVDVVRSSDLAVSDEDHFLCAYMTERAGNAVDALVLDELQQLAPVALLVSPALRHNLVAA